MSKRFVSVLLLLTATLPACGAKVGTPNTGNLGDGGGGGGGDLRGGCHSNSPCDVAGATQCSGERVQTCTDDGKGCLSWSPSDPCPDGQVCDGNKCTDTCSLPAVVTACTQAAKDVNNCCANLVGGNMLDARGICQQFIAIKKDPRVECLKYTLQTDCMMVQAMLGNGICCCQVDFTCDPEGGNKCVVGCSTKASCSGNPGGGSCAPVGVNGVVTQRGYVCRPDDGKPLHGCVLIADNGCDNGYDCWRDKKSNPVCTKSCNVDADCGNPGVACCIKPPDAICNRTLSKCAGAGGCLPCP